MNYEKNRGKEVFIRNVRKQPEHSHKKADTLNLSIKAAFCKVADISRKEYSDRYKRSFQEQVKYKLFEIVSFKAGSGPPQAVFVSSIRACVFLRGTLFS